MKILFTSDLHSNKAAFKSFAHTLNTQDYSVGVIAGDLTEGWIRKEELFSLLPDVTEDDFIEELNGPDNNNGQSIDSWFKHFDLIQLRGLMVEEKQLKTILFKTKKPILIIRGNHDRTTWVSEKNVYNINKKSVLLGGYQFIGLEQDIPDGQDQSFFHKLSSRINKNTILVTHIPPRTILDTNSQGDKIGRVDLYRLVLTTAPYLHLFGHVHENRGVIGSFLNGSFVDLRGFYSIKVESRKLNVVDSCSDINLGQR